METLQGSITSVGFASGHRFVIGDWRDGRIYSVRSDGLRLDMKIGLAPLRLPPRLRSFTATVENWCARKLLDATASLDGVGLRSLAPLDRPLGFGCTDPPSQPSHVRLRVDLQRPG